MSTRTAVSSGAPITLKVVKRSRWHIKNLDSFLVLLPSLIAIAIFVYGFIGITFYVSLSNWRVVKPDMTLRQPLFPTYGDRVALPRLPSDLRNTLVFTVFFIGLSVAVGLGLANFIDHHLQLPIIPVLLEG